MVNLVLSDWIILVHFLICKKMFSKKVWDFAGGTERFLSVFWRIFFEEGKDLEEVK